MLGRSKKKIPIGFGGGNNNKKIMYYEEKAAININIPKKITR